MKTIARIATGALVALVSVFIATPAFAEEEHGHQGTLGAAVEFSTAGEPLQVIPILICGAILLVIVLALSGWIGNAFEKKRG